MSGAGRSPEAEANGWVRAGACTARGPRAFNEDAHVLMCNWAPEPEPGRGPAALFAVCDGHGGAAVARWAAQRLGDELQAELAEGWWTGEDARRTAAECAFLAMDRGILRTMGRAAATCGATCVAAAVRRHPKEGASSRAGADGCCRTGGPSAQDEQSHVRSRSRSPASSPTGTDEEPVSGSLLLMNLGDSRGLLCRHGVGVVKETADHKPDCPAELARIKASNGFVSQANRLNPARVDGVLSVARALGDFHWKGDDKRAPEAQRISPLPDVYDLEVHGGDVLVLACDGVFDVLSSDRVAGLVLQALGAAGGAPGGGDAGSPEASDPVALPRQAAEAVVQLALEQGSADNVTCVVAQLLGD